MLAPDTIPTGAGMVIAMVLGCIWAFLELRDRR